MKLRSASVALLGSIALAACSDTMVSPPTAAAPRAQAVLSRYGTLSADRHVMEFNSGIPADLAARVAAKGGTLVRVDAGIGMAVTSGLSDADAEAIGGRANTVRDMDARWVPTPEEVGAELAADVISEPAADATAKHPLTATRYLAGQQWNMQQIQADAAWAQNRTGIPSVRVAILDTGLDPNHIDQNGTVIDMASSTFFTPSTSVDPGPRWVDDQYHGTHVGSIVTSNNVQVAGVAPNVTLVAVKVLNAAGSGSFADIISGIVYSADVGVQVINMSLGAYFERNGREAAQLHRLLNKAINYAHAREVLVVSSAGNDNQDLQHNQNFIKVPCEEGVQLCVSATGQTNAKASYSNFGTNSIDVAAPGGDADRLVIGVCSSYTMVPALAACKTRNRYLNVAGTSQAAPHVSGLGAYLDSQFGGTLKASQLITAIEQHSDDLGKPGSDPIYGKGRINVFSTLNEEAPLAPVVP